MVLLHTTQLKLPGRPTIGSLQCDQRVLCLTSKVCASNGKYNPIAAHYPTRLFQSLYVNHKFATLLLSFFYTSLYQLLL